MNYINNHCLFIETKSFSNSLFEKSIDATYIMHLEGNGRISSIHEQLKVYKPTNIVHIVFNKGFTKCNKSLPIQEPAFDLIDTVKYIFIDAKEKGYGNILILEDDFLFSKEILNSTHLNNINNILREKKEETMLYSLGALCWVILPYNNHTHINILSTGSHAVIYTKSSRNDFLSKKTPNLYDLDIYQNIYWGIKRYVYYKPLCYQLFPTTENSEKWPSFFGFNPIKIYIKYTNLDKKAENGFSYSYFMAKINGYLLILFLIILIIFLLVFIYKKSINVRKKVKLIKNKG
jgi:hypothetical protein